VTDPAFEHAADADADVEVVDALPVPEAHEIPAPQPVAPAAPPVASAADSARGLVVAAPVAVQAAAVAVTGFAAGAATVAVVRKARARKQLRSRRGKALGREVLASRSFLVDVHLLNRD
jgi:hypothetical protein